MKTDTSEKQAEGGETGPLSLFLFLFLSIDSEVGIHSVSSAALVFWCLCQSLSVSLSVFKLITVCFEQISIKPLFTDRETIRARAGGDMVCWLNGSVLHFIELKWKENMNAGAEVWDKRKSPSGKYGVLLWLSLINTDFLKSSEVTANRVRLPHMRVQSERSWVACLHNLLPVSINHQSLTGQGAMRGWKREENLTWSKTSMWKKQPLCRVSNTNRKHQANTLIMLAIKAAQSQSTSLSFITMETLRIHLNISACLHTKSHSLFAFNIH